MFDKISWLHISDLHLKQQSASWSQDVVLRALHKASTKLCASKPVNLVLATGDLSYSGKKDEFLQVESFFDAILKDLIIAGRLTEDIPAYVQEPDGFEGLKIIVDVRHGEVRKLQVLGFSSLLYSVIATFAREYLGPSLKKWSPRFFGDGALNLELLAKQRSELWILVKDDIGVIQKGAERQVVTSSDVRVVNVGAPPENIENQQGQKLPKALKIVDESGQTDLAGHYIRLPDTAYRAYGDLIQEYDHRGAIWGGNKIGYVVSDAISASFQYEIRLDEAIAVREGTVSRAEGSQQITKPLQLMFDGLYFPIPEPLERYLVPVGEASIRLRVDCDLFDMTSARRWISAAQS